MVSWPHGSPSQGHSVPPGTVLVRDCASLWNREFSDTGSRHHLPKADAQREALLSTNDVIASSNLLVNKSLQKKEKKRKKIRFEVIALSLTCLIMHFLREIREAVPHTPGLSRGPRMAEPSSSGPGDGALQVSEGPAHVFPTPSSAPRIFSLDQVPLSPLLCDKSRHSPRWGPRSRVSCSPFWTHCTSST